MIASQIRKIDSYIDICNAKNIIGKEIAIKPDDVIEKSWSLMTAEQVLHRSMCGVNDKVRVELKRVSGEFAGVSRMSFATAKRY